MPPSILLNGLLFLARPLNFQSLPDRRSASDYLFESWQTHTMRGRPASATLQRLDKRSMDGVVGPASGHDGDTALGGGVKEPLHCKATIAEEYDLALRQPVTQKPQELDGVVSGQLPLWFGGQWD
jgi:hypothetical protein